MPDNPIPPANGSNINNPMTYNFINDLYSFLKDCLTKVSDLQYNIIYVDGTSEVQLAAAINQFIKDSIKNKVIDSPKTLVGTNNGFELTSGTYYASTENGSCHIKYDSKTKLYEVYTRCFDLRYRTDSEFRAKSDKSYRSFIQGVTKQLQEYRLINNDGWFASFINWLTRWICKLVFYPLATVGFVASKVFVYTNNIERLETIVESLKDIHSNPVDDAIYYEPLKDQWRFAAARERRDLSKLPTNKGMKDVLDDVDTFIKGKDTYKSDGKPYRRGYLIHGPPGTGKTISAEIISSKYQRNVYLINVTGDKMTNENFSNLFKTIPPNSLILMDEIDKGFEELARRKGNKISLDTILSSLGGIVPLADGCILIMTANEINFLPEDKKSCLIRPGRIDKCFELTEVLDS